MKWHRPCIELADRKSVVSRYLLAKVCHTLYLLLRLQGGSQFHQTIHIAVVHAQNKVEIEEIALRDGTRQVGYVVPSAFGVHTHS